MKGLASEIISSLEDCLEQKEGNSQQRVEEPGPVDVQSPRRKASRSIRYTSIERDLTKVREAHWRALATAAALEEKIEWLNWSTTWGWSDICGHSRGQDCHRRSQG